MIAGPVFHFELVRTARQRRFYVARFAFGLILLAIIGMNYASYSATAWFRDGVGMGEIPIHEMRLFGYTIFGSLMVAQAALLLGLTPAFVADAVASERQRKTLHYLMASRLTSVDIVLGKLAARLLNVGTYLAASLPVVSILTLFGGIDPAMVVLIYAAMGSTAFFLAALAIFASVTSRRPRDAVGASYGLGALWLAGPPIVGVVVQGVVSAFSQPRGSASWISPGVFAAIVVVGFAAAALALVLSALLRKSRDPAFVAYALISSWLVGLPLAGAAVGLLSPAFATNLGWAESAAGWLSPASPLGMLDKGGPFYTASFDARWREVAWMIGSQVGFGAILVAVAAWQVRPSFRRIESRADRPPAIGKASRRWLGRRPCGDDPVFWKEAYFTRTGGGLLRSLARLLIPGLMACVVLGIYAYHGPAAINEAWREGFGTPDYPHGQARLALNMAIRFGGTAFFAAWMLHLAVLTAASVASEREQDTWLGLLATPLEGAEILRGKMLGALRATARYGVPILALWLLGLVAGAIHPFGIVAALAAVSLFTCHVTALGTYLSLKSKSTWKAQAWTLAIVIVPHLCCVSPIVGMAWVVGFAPMSYGEVDELSKSISRFDLGDSWSWFFPLAVAYVVGNLAYYLGVTFFTARAAFAGFDATADRPRHPRRGPKRPGGPKKMTLDGGVEVELS